MRVNDDLSCPVIVAASREDWVRSPVVGVDRRMLFRIGGEVARATSIVRYAPGSAFPRHTHGGGEEILVLDGIFQDEHGDFPADTYIRNPPGTSHVPASHEGCTIFVRLWQFRDGDVVQVVRRPGEGRNAALRPGAAAATILFDDGHEEVRLERWKACGRVTVENSRGLEFLVLAGSMRMFDKWVEPQSWGRLPAVTQLNADIGPSDVRIWIKDGPLGHPDVCRLPRA